MADSKDSSKQTGSGGKKGALDTFEASKRKDSGSHKHGETAANGSKTTTDDEKKLAAERRTPPVVNGHADIPTASVSQSTPVESATGNSMGDFSKVDFGKVKEFVPEMNKTSSGPMGGARGGEQPILVAKPSIDSEADVTPSPTVATVTDQSAECAGQEVTVYQFDLKKNSQVCSQPCILQ